MWLARRGMEEEQSRRWWLRGGHVEEGCGLGGSAQERDAWWGRDLRAGRGRSEQEVVDVGMGSACREVEEWRKWECSASVGHGREGRDGGEGREEMEEAACSNGGGTHGRRNEGCAQWSGGG